MGDAKNAKTFLTKSVVLCALCVKPFADFALKKKTENKNDSNAKNAKMGDAKNAKVSSTKAVVLCDLCVKTLRTLR